MLLYILVAMWPLIVGYLYDYRVGRYLPARDLLTKKTIKSRRNWLIIAALPMFLLIAMRGASIGADTAGYQKFYKVTAQTSWEYIFYVFWIITSISWYSRISNFKFIIYFLYHKLIRY